MSEPEFDYPETGVVLPEDRPGDWLVDYARRAADAGFESVWASEAWGPSPFPLLGRISEHVECTLGTCIANAYARSPGALAASALAMHDATDGGFVLGLGASTPAIVEGFHGEAFDRPLRRLRELMEILDLALAGDPIDYDGEVFDLSGFRLQGARDARVPVFNAALGRTNIALAIDHAEGFLPHLMPLPALDDAVAAAEERAHSSAADLHVSPSIPTAVSADPAAAREVLAGHVAFYAGSTAFYNDVIADNGFPEAAAAIREAWQEGGRAAAAEVVPADLVDAIGIAGTPETARERVEELLAGPVDTALLSFPHGTTEEMMEATLDVLG
ncbi:MAG: LLM class flavin-dependent oxidoreductase [Haloarculaceae archaeon]